MASAYVGLTLLFGLVLNLYFARLFIEYKSTSQRIRNISYLALLIILFIFGRELNHQIDYLTLFPLAIFTLAIFVVDLTGKRIPNVLNASLATTQLVSVAVFSLLNGFSQGFYALLIGSFSLLAYLTLNLLSNNQFGMGDVKLSFSIGLGLGLFGWELAANSIIISFLLAGCYSFLLLISGRATFKTKFSFGPFMVSGAWIAIIIS